MNREQWLTGLCAVMADTLFKPHAYVVPGKIRISVGWPKGSRKATGQCFVPAASADNHSEIFISPVLSDALEVAATVAHEIGHTILPPGTGHKKPFAKLVSSVGLIGKPTATSAGGPFMAWWRDYADAMGDYPHAKLSPGMELKKQTTRLIRIHCPACSDNGEAYILRASSATIQRGLPICPMHETPLST